MKRIIYLYIYNVNNYFMIMKWICVLHIYRRDRIFFFSSIIYFNTHSERFSFLERIHCSLNENWLIDYKVINFVLILNSKDIKYLDLYWTIQELLRTILPFFSSVILSFWCSTFDPPRGSPRGKGKRNESDWEDVFS